MNNILTVVELNTRDQDQVQALRKFCDQCRDLGISNNSSLEKMKIDKSYDRDYKFWAVWNKDQNEIVGISGCHVLPEISEKCFRILFRGCILPAYRGRGGDGLSKKHLNSYIFKYTAPPQIKWARENGAEMFVISTNKNTLPGMSSTDRLFHHLARQGLVKIIRQDFMLFSTLQNIWQVESEFFSL